MVAGSFLCLADLIVNALPILIVAKLKIPGRQRITIGILLCIGSLATLAGIVREVWIYKTLLATNDWTWEALPLWICAEAEIYIALVSRFLMTDPCYSLTPHQFCACAPALKPIWTKMRGGVVDAGRKLQAFERMHPDKETPPSFEMRKYGEGGDPFDGNYVKSMTQVTATREPIEFNRSRRRSIVPCPRAVEAGFGTLGILKETRIELQ